MTIRNRVTLLCFLFLFLVSSACLLPVSIIPIRDIPTATAAPTTAMIPLPPGSPEFDPSRVGTVAKDVVYCTIDKVALKMDVYFPKRAGSSWAGVMYVHGGGWVSGDKSRGAGIEEVPALVAAGFLVAAVNYRLAPDYSFPAMIEDLRCAVRYLRAHAAELNLDPLRIGAFGTSAGGHLVALMGTAGEMTGWDVGEYLGQSSRVQAVVDYFGPTDLTDPQYLDQVDWLHLKAMGARDIHDPALAIASPVNYVTPDDPPFLIMHGDRDNVVALTHSTELYALLQQAGVPSRLVIVLNGGHGFAQAGEGPMVPSREEIIQLTVDFFLEELFK
jgi:acetyl esterase/lipase